jgi:hypothetical protein
MKLKQQKIWLNDEIERKRTSTKVLMTQLEIKKKWGLEWKIEHMRNCN